MSEVIPFVKSSYTFDLIVLRALGDYSAKISLTISLMNVSYSGDGT